MTKSKSISSKKKNELTLNDTEQNTILATIYDGGIPHIVIKDTLKISLMSFYKFLDQNPKFKEKFNQAQEIGIKTLVEKMLAIFSSDVTEMSNEELLFLREKQNYLKLILVCYLIFQMMYIIEKIYQEEEYYIQFHLKNRILKNTLVIIEEFLV